MDAKDEMVSVHLDTVDLEYPGFEDYLRANGISYEVVQAYGYGGGWPDVKYSGRREAIEAMIILWWGDEHLLTLIEK